MSDVTRFEQIEKVIKDAEKCVVLMEQQKKELEAQLKSAGFDSVEELESCLDGMDEVADAEEEKLSAKFEELHARLLDACSCD